MTSRGGTATRWPAAGEIAEESGLTEQKPRENRSERVKQNKGKCCINAG